MGRKDIERCPARVGLSSNGVALGPDHDSCNAFPKLRNALVKSLIGRLDLGLCHRELLNCPTKGQYLDPALSCIVILETS